MEVRVTSDHVAITPFNDGVLALLQQPAHEPMTASLCVHIYDRGRIPADGLKQYEAAAPYQ